MGNEKIEENEEVIKLREMVLQAENERMNGEPALSIAEARMKLRERLQ